MRLWMIILLLANSGCAFAASYTYGDWVTEIGNGYRDASTSNASGSSIGVFCSLSTETCVAYFQSNTRCEQGSTQVALINVDDGAFSTKMSCAPIKSSSGIKYVEFIYGFDRMRRELTNNTDIGLALPLESGLFKIVRFSLRGSKSAINSIDRITGSGQFHDQVR